MTNNYDFIIVGSGGAGLYTALKAREFGRVLILTKGSLGDGSTPLAQGGIAAAIGPEDSSALHRDDTLRAGRGLCDPDAVSVLVNDAADCIADLIRLSLPFDYDGEHIAFGLEGAHSVPRVLHAGGDATGFMLQRSLEQELEHLDGITVLGEHLVTEIIVQDGVCQGVRALDIRANVVKEFAAHFVVLAAGGYGRLYSHTTNAEGATGDGIAVAFRAGAVVADMEFMQFHPTVFCLPTEHHFLISEAVRGEGAILRDFNGRAFMKDYDPRGELAPRDVVTRAILKEMENTQHRCTYLDITHEPEDKIKERFPSIYRHCLEHGINMAHDYIPVAPAAHYSIGGVKTNLWGETNIANLFACGEVASTGVHGANRLASNSLLELLVFGRRVVERATALGLQKRLEPSSPKSGQNQADLQLELNLEPSVYRHAVETRDLVSPNLATLQSMAWDQLGVVRQGIALEEAHLTLRNWSASLMPPKSLADHELANLILIGRLVTEAAATRRESRGTHYRSDYPSESPAWRRHIVLRLT